MKPPKTSINALTALALLTGPVISATLYWDGTDTDADANGGDGTWDNGVTRPRSIRASR